jgi:hypothetical protein
MGVVSTCAFSFMSKYLHQSCGPKPMTRVDINDNNQSSNMDPITLQGGFGGHWPPTYIAKGGKGEGEGGEKFWSPPWWRFGGSALEEKFLGKLSYKIL